jgi:N4-gp56 family major capsid protein
MSWTWDAPTATYRSHTLSSQIRREAIADAQFMKFMKPEPGFGKGKGESITITRINKLPLATRVSETERLPSNRPAIETKTVSVSQWGSKIPITEFERHLTHFNLRDEFQRVLKDQITETMDKMCADALKLTDVKYTPLSTGGEFVTTGTPVSVSNRNWEVQDLRRIHDRLHGDLKCPKFKGGRYIGILSTRAARGLKNDPEYKDWLAPTTSQPLMDGLLKNIEGFDLYETNQRESMADLLGTSTTTGDAIFFGADAGGLITIMAPELRVGLAEELGTFQEVGWVGTIEAFHVWERPAMARVIHGASL